MAMPGQPAIGRLPVAEQTAECGDPQRNGEQGKQAAAEKKRAKPQAPDGRDLQRLAAIENLHGHVPCAVEGRQRVLARFTALSTFALKARMQACRNGFAREVRGSIVTWV